MPHGSIRRSGARLAVLVAVAVAGCSGTRAVTPQAPPARASVPPLDAQPPPVERAEPARWTVEGVVTAPDGTPAAGAEVLVGLRAVPDPEARGACAAPPLDLLAAVRVRADARGRYRAAVDDPALDDLGDRDLPTCLVASAWPPPEPFRLQARALAGRTPAGAADPVLTPDHAARIDLTAPAPPPPRPDPSRVDRDGWDAAFARDVVPGFAGVYVSGDTLVVRLGAPTAGDAERERAAVEAVLARDGMERFRDAPVRVEPAERSAADLVAVRDRATPLWQLAGVSGSDLDETAGQAVYGFETEADARRARQSLAGLGLADEPVRIEVMGRTGWGPPPDSLAPARPVYGDRVTWHGTDPAWGPDGREIWVLRFQAPGSRYPATVVAVDVTTGAERVVGGVPGSNGGASDLVVGPGRADVLIRGPDRRASHVVRLDDGEARVLTTDATGLDVAASPDGRTLAYARDPDGDIERARLALVDLASGRASPLDVAGRVAGPFAFSPDGATLVVAVDGSPHGRADPDRAGVWAIGVSPDARPGRARRLLPFAQGPRGWAVPPAVDVWWDEGRPHLAVGASADGAAWVDRLSDDGARAPVGLAVPAVEAPGRVAVSADGRRVAAAVVVDATPRGVEGDRAARTRIYLWDTSARSAGGALAAPEMVADVAGEPPLWLAFSPDGRRLAYATRAVYLLGLSD